MKKIDYSEDSLKFVVNEHEFEIFELKGPGQCSTTSGMIVIFDYDENNDFENPKVVGCMDADNLIFKLGTELDFGTYESNDSKLDFMRWELDCIEAFIDEHMKNTITK